MQSEASWDVLSTATGSPTHLPGSFPATMAGQTQALTAAFGGLPPTYLKDKLIRGGGGLGSMHCTLSPVAALMCLLALLGALPASPWISLCSTRLSCRTCTAAMCGRWPCQRPCDLHPAHQARSTPRSASMADRSMIRAAPCPGQYHCGYGQYHTAATSLGTAPMLCTGVPRMSGRGGATAASGAASSSSTAVYDPRRAAWPATHRAA